MVVLLLMAAVGAGRDVAYIQQPGLDTQSVAFSGECLLDQTLIHVVRVRMKCQCQQDKFSDYAPGPCAI
jgi:hypothetical protein